MDKANLIGEFVDKTVIDSLSVLLSSENADEIAQSSLLIASQFGSNYDVSSQENVGRLIKSFKKNLTLLIEKTWVEQSDISLKEEILVKLEQFCTSIENDKWADVFSSFIKILNDVIYLMFGSIAKSPEFDEYSLRIDPEFGIFCWYVRSLPNANSWSNEKNKAVLLIAMFFLANY